MRTRPAAWPAAHRIRAGPRVRERKTHTARRRLSHFRAPAFGLGRGQPAFICPRSAVSRRVGSKIWSQRAYRGSRRRLAAHLAPAGTGLDAKHAAGITTALGVFVGYV